MGPQGRPGTLGLAPLTTHSCTDTFWYWCTGSFAHRGLVKLFILKVEGEFFSKSFYREMLLAFDSAGMKMIKRC